LTLLSGGRFRCGSPGGRLHSRDAGWLLLFDNEICINQLHTQLHIRLQTILIPRMTILDAFQSHVKRNVSFEHRHQKLPGIHVKRYIHQTTSPQIIKLSHNTTYPPDNVINPFPLSYHDPPVSTTNSTSPHTRNSQARLFRTSIQP